MTDIVKRLREPPFGTETSERNIMSAAADEIEQLRAKLREARVLLDDLRFHDLSGKVDKFLSHE